MSGLSFYMHDGPATFRFELAGALAGVEVGRLDQAWRTASSTFDGKTLAVDVTFLTTADEKGRDLLFRWWREGAHLIASSERSRALVEDVTGAPYADAPVGPTFEPRFSTSAFRAAAAMLIVAGTLLFPAKASADDSSAVLERYSAGLADRGLDTGSVSVEVEGSVARLDKRARVEAIRRWSGGKRAYQFVTVEGDSFVRNEMIARYFAMDTEGEPMAAAITKSNYKFKFVNTNGTSTVFQITPRRKRLGMIAGEMWIDTESGLVTHLEGRMVKSPSVLLKRVDITQEMEIRDGVTVGRETHVGISTRFTGHAELTVRERVAAEVAENVTQ
jgi:hypothetical protein